MVGDVAELNKVSEIKIDDYVDVRDKAAGFLISA